jgi:hypothetical protein
MKITGCHQIGTVRILCSYIKTLTSQTDLLFRGNITTKENKL